MKSRPSSTANNASSSEFVGPLGATGLDANCSSPSQSHPYSVGGAAADTTKHKENIYGSPPGHVDAESERGQDSDVQEYANWWPLEHDQELDLRSWLMQPSVTLMNASMLLLGRQPGREKARDHADVQALALVFEHYLTDKRVPPLLPLTGWLSLARTLQAQYAPSVAHEIDIVAARIASAADPAARPVDDKVPLRTRSHRRDALTYLIHAAVRESAAGGDPAQVFLVLKSWASKQSPRPPLFGVTEDGKVQWTDTNGSPKELSLAALRDRLRRISSG